MSQGNAKPALVIVPYVMGAKTLALFLGIGERMKTRQTLSDVPIPMYAWDGSHLHGTLWVNVLKGKTALFVLNACLATLLQG